LRAILSSMGALELSTGRWVLVLLLAVLLTAAVVTLDLWIAHRTERFRSGDFFQFWAAGRAILQGDDPYDPLSWRDIYQQQGHWRWQTDQRVFLYPLWTAFPFVPFALLPVSTATLLWTLTSQALLLLTVAMWVKALDWIEPAAWLLLIMVSTVAFEPVSLTILFGHLGIVLLCLITGTLYLANRGRYAQAGVLVALTLIKPQLFLLVYPVLIVTMILYRRWGFLISFSATVAALFLSSWLLVPNWIEAWLEHLARSATVRLSISPTIWGATHSVAMALHRQDLWLTMAIAALAVLLGVLAYALHAHRQTPARAGTLEPSLSLSLIASLLIAPYVLSYDFVLLLLPISTCLWIAQRLAKQMRRVIVISVVGCAIILPWALLAVSTRTGQETTNVVVPLSLFVILLAAAHGRGHRDELSPLPEPARPQHLDGTSGGTVCPL